MMTSLAIHDPCAAGSPALRTRDLAVGYRTRRLERAVLEHVNLAVHAGELICLLGSNGVGKSTLLRTLAGMQPALRGSIEVGGADLRFIAQRDLARRLGVVLTERVAVEALRVRRIVELGRYPHSGFFAGMTERDRRVVEWAIGAVGAGHLAERDVSRLSDGEHQRVMIARALAQEPMLLVLDEPTAFLDVASRVELMVLLRRLTRGGSLAVVASTHDLESALRLADVVWLVMPDGDLVSGAPEDVILTGRLAHAFGGPHIRFRPEERTFEQLAVNRGDALVSGSGLRASLAKAVLEREGYSVAPAATPTPGALAVQTSEAGWCVSADGVDCSGATFASLAAFLRSRRTTS